MGISLGYPMHLTVDCNSLPNAELSCLLILRKQTNLLLNITSFVCGLYLNTLVLLSIEIVI